MIEIPSRLRDRPVYGGLAIGYITRTLPDGRPCNGVNDELKRMQVIRERRCGQCCQPLDRWIAFIVTEVEAADGLVEEPGMHRECAEYAMAVCPFLAHGIVRSRPVKIAPGEKLVMAPWSRGPDSRPRIGIYITSDYRAARMLSGQLMVRMSPPKKIRWYDLEEPNESS